MGANIHPEYPPCARQTLHFVPEEYTILFLNETYISFFKSRCTVIWDISSTIWSCTAFSLKSRNVHLEYPLGGSLHERAIIFVSDFPSSLSALGGVSRFLRVRYDTMSWWERNSSRILYTAWTDIWAYSAVRLYLTWSAFHVRSNINSTRARVIMWALCTPLRTISFNCFCSSSVRYISLFCILVYSLYFFF